MNDSAEVTSLSQRSFERFARFITEELGIKMPESKLTMVQSRLLRRVRELRLDNVEQYGAYFFSDTDPAERDHFISAITTNKTDFFREPEHFTYLQQTVLPRLAGDGVVCGMLLRGGSVHLGYAA
jgi:chemotaxis protein methyltransferase CheR